MPAAGIELRYELLFRDYLRTHPALIREYVALKRKLAAKHFETLAYIRGKREFVAQVVNTARAERGLGPETEWDD